MGFMGAEAGGWPGGARAAISITYDGAWPGHYELVAPLLDQLDLAATFYLEPTRLLDNPRAWHRVASRNEIGSHTLYEAADELGRLCAWTLEAVEADCRSAPNLLEEATGAERPFGFAFPGPEPFCREGSYARIVRRTFVHARTVEPGLNRLDVDPFSLRSIDTTGADLGRLQEVVAEAIDAGAWAIFRFDGIGVGERAIDASVHEAFVRDLLERPDLCVATVGSVCDAIEG
jgi:peptidoglycan/xylan/chitin deacetylase (PgdA/CDA1 family)